MLKVRIINKPDFIELEKEINSFIEREQIEDDQFVSVKYQIYLDGPAAPKFDRFRNDGPRDNFRKPPTRNKMFSAMLVYKK